MPLQINFYFLYLKTKTVLYSKIEDGSWTEKSSKEDICGTFICKLQEVWYF